MTATPMLDAEQKPFETLRAAAARHGVALYELTDGTYLLCGWNMHRELATLDEARELMARMGVVT